MKFDRRRANYALFLPVVVALATGSFAASAISPQPSPIDWSRAAESIVDLSQFLDAPAGKGGSIRVDRDHLVRPDGTRFRIWGVNITGGNCFPAKALAPVIAADLARYGINCVRFHHLDTRGGGIFDATRDDTLSLDADKLDRLDCFIAELKRRGIYANLNLNVSRQYKPGDGVRDFNLLGLAKGATYFNPRLIELQRNYARQLLTHRNPYTGADYAHEPAVACVEIVNENSLMEAWVSGRLGPNGPRDGDRTWGPLPASYCDELTAQYNAWLAKNVPPAELARLRASAGVDEDQPVPRLDGRAAIANAPRERFLTEARFIMEQERLFFEGMKKLLRDELGVQSLLVGSSDHNHTISGYPHELANSMFDVLDGHVYWEHPIVRPTFRLKNDPMVNAPADSTVVELARTPILGRPFTISEVNDPFPNEYACEGIPILTAYALLHDWDGIYWFMFGEPRDPAQAKQRVATFDISNEPVKMSQLAACGLMFHRRDLHTAKRTIVRSYSPDAVVDSIRLPQTERPFFTNGFARTTPLQFATRLTFSGESTLPFPDSATGDVIRADRDQIAWYHDASKQGLVTIDSERTQALVGFVKQRGIATTNLAAETENVFCALMLTSLDGKPIAQSSRLILTTGSRVANQGMTWTDDHHALADWGTWPPVVEPVTGTVIVRGLENVRSVACEPLAGEGRPLGEQRTLAADGAGWRIPVGDPVAVWYLLSVNR